VSPRLGLLVAHPALALEWVSGQEHADREIRWVHASELADPAPFLEGGELLLTTGMRMTASASAAKAYVGRLVEARVTGLGFAVGLGHDVIPKALINACSAAGLPLLLVPVQTPFIQISKTVSDLIAIQEREELARSLESQRALVRAAADGDGPTALVARLAREVKGWALLLDAGGRVMHASPASAQSRARDLLPEIERIRPKGLLAGSSMTAAGERISLQPLGVNGRAQGFLAVGAPEPWGRATVGAMTVAVSLLSLEGARSRSTDAVRERLDEVAVSLALQGHARDLPWDLLGWSWMQEAPVDVAVIDVDEPAATALADRIREAGTACLAVRLDGELLVISAFGDSTGAMLDALIDPVLAATPGARAGRATCDGPEDLADGRRRARQAMAARSRVGSGVAQFDDLADAGLMALVDDDVADGFSDASLAPLLGLPASEDLLASLDAWLSRHGQWDAAAHELGVHRHTLRHRIRRIEGLLDRSLDDPGTRMELWFALRRRALRG